MATVVGAPQGFSADAASLPPWENVLRRMTAAGCVFHHRRVTGAYAAREYRLAYSQASARHAGSRWRPLEYTVRVVVTRPTGGGEVVKLPERTAIRAVCLMPYSERGALEAVARVEAVLEGMGILDPSNRAVQWALGTPARRVPGGVLEALAWMRSRLAALPLAAQDTCSVAQAEAGECVIVVEDVVATAPATPVPISCPAGFDFEATTGTCAYHGDIVGVDPGAGDPGDGGGGGDSGDGGDGEMGPRSVAFTFACDGSTERGSQGGCTVSAPESEGVSLATLRFAWSSDRGTGPSGNGLSAWNGVAINSTTVTVAVTDPTGTIAAFADSLAIAVTPRLWAFTPPTPASGSSGYGSNGWPAGKWGQHDPGTTSINPHVIAGTGPWEGMFTGSHPPIHLGDNNITIHSDFDPTDAGHPGANSVACFAANSPATSANLVDVNAACGSSSKFAQWKNLVIQHEEAHAIGGDGCLRSTTTVNKIAELERITATSADGVRNRLNSAWTAHWFNAVVPSFEGRLTTPTSPVMWEYRFRGSWMHHALRGVREGGNVGC